MNKLAIFPFLLILLAASVFAAAPSITITAPNTAVDFNYAADGNTTIDFNISDADLNMETMFIGASTYSLTVSLYYTTELGATGTAIWTDLNLLDTNNGNWNPSSLAVHCHDLNFNSGTGSDSEDVNTGVSCTWDWNIINVSDGLYYVYGVVYDGTTSVSDYSDYKFGINNVSWSDYDIAHDPTITGYGTDDIMDITQSGFGTFGRSLTENLALLILGVVVVIVVAGIVVGIKKLKSG